MSAIFSDDIIKQYYSFLHSINIYAIHINFDFCKPTIDPEQSEGEFYENDCVWWNSLRNICILAIFLEESAEMSILL